MKKHKITLALIIALISISTINLYLTNGSLKEFDLLLKRDIESMAYNESGEGAPTCAAGGCYATACSFNGQIEILGNGVTYSNSVTCQDAWACCYTTDFCFDKKRCP